jgi:hypothetical protein
MRLGFATMDGTDDIYGNVDECRGLTSTEKL